MSRDFQYIKFTFNLSTFALVTGIDSVGTLPLIIKKSDPKGCIRIHDGRHPILEQILNGWGSATPVGTSIHLGGLKQKDNNPPVSRRRVAILTGPNGSGKTVFMKMVGLICYMAHLGCFVPAKYAQLPLLDSIVTSFSTIYDDYYIEPPNRPIKNYFNEQIESEMLCLSDLLNSNSKGRNLVLLDEFFHGFEKLVAKAMKKVLIEELIYARNDENVIENFVILSTHDHDFVREIMKTNLPITSLCSKVLHHGNNLIYQYSIVKGFCEKSYCLQVAKETGFPDEILNRATKVEGLSSKNQELHDVDEIKRCQSVLNAFDSLNGQVSLEDLIQLFQN